MTSVTDGSVDTLRQFNRQRVLAALREMDSASRAELSRASGLSRNTVASIVAELQREGVVRETGHPGARAAGAGRPPTLLSLAPAAGLGLAVDIGHQHVRVALGDAAGTVVEERFTELPQAVAPRDMLATAADLVRAATVTLDPAARPLAGVTLGLPAPVDNHGRPVTQRFGGLDPLVDAGVADLGALGEAYFGAARGVDDFVFVKVSHGIGAGLVLGRRLYRGARGLAGNLGHVRVREDGDVCLCGNRGCLETLVSARAMLAALQPAHPGRTLAIGDLFDLVRDGDAGARVLVTDAGRVIGRTLAEVVAVLNPAAVVVGGGLSALGGPLLAGIRESIGRYSQPAAMADLRVVPAECGDRAAVLGGLAVALGLTDASLPVAPATRVG